MNDQGPTASEPIEAATSELGSSPPDDQHPSLCFFQFKDMAYCVQQDIGILLFLVIAALFAYQIIAVWVLSYKYHLCFEPRINTMGLCLAYSLFKIMETFLDDKPKMYMEFFTEYLKLQACMWAMKYYTKKVMNILPIIREQWLGTLKVAYVLINMLILVAITVAVFQIN